MKWWSGATSGPRPRHKTLVAPSSLKACPGVAESLVCSKPAVGREGELAHDKGYYHACFPVVACVGMLISHGCILIRAAAHHRVTVKGNREARCKAGFSF